MIRSAEELAHEIGRASRSSDLKRLQELEACFLVNEEPGRLPLAPNVRLDPDAIELGADLVESDRVLGLANAVSRAKRRVLYYRRKWDGYSGPVVVSEGDSWFQYPIRLDDVIDVLMEELNVLSLGAAGDLLASMASHAEYVSAIEEERADFFLISGGGNDMLHSGRLAEFLKPYADGMGADEVVERERWSLFLSELTSTYRGIFMPIVTRFPRLTILCHGYDYALPRVNGKWLGQPLARRGVPKPLWNDVVRILINGFNDALKKVAADFPNRVVHVDCRGAVGDSQNSWFDELHPRDSGYQRVAELFAKEIKKGHDRGPLFEGLGAGTPAAVVTRDDSRGALTSPLPKRVANQFLARVVEIARPVPGGPGANERAILEEAIIDAGRPDVGPVLPRAPVIQQDGGLYQPDSECPSHTCQTVRSVMTSVLENGEMPQPTAAPVSPAAAVDDAQLLRQPPCSSLAAWQAHLRHDRDAIPSYNDYVEVRRAYDDREDEDRVRTRLQLQPETDVFFQERVIGRSNLEQINFLSRGGRAARAVGRLSVLSEYGIPAGTGTGFLVGPGLLLTNNHVLPRAVQGEAGSYVLFDYEYDADNRLKASERFALTGEVFLTDPELDFTFVSVASTGSRGSRIEAYRWLKLVPESGKALKGEAISIIQHPNGLPKQIAIRESTVVGRKGAYVYYFADTNPGSSGAPAVNDQWFPVALHHRSVPDYFNPCKYVANRGVRISKICEKLRHAEGAGNEMAARVLERIDHTPPLDSSVGSVELPSSVDGQALYERLVEPYHELPYDNREGYDKHFLGRRVRMPQVNDPSAIAAPRIDTSNPRYVLHYEHFSLVMHKARRLALFTAANVDASPAAKKPEAGKKYSRKALGGLGQNDREKWFQDPRIATEHQLPDRFFERDDGAFDKGHLTMRSEVAWGFDYDEVRRANGDTFHATNCSPQVKEFNRAIFGYHGLWGELEEIVLDEADSEKLCVFAGPVLADDDRNFRGRGHDGELLVQIPSKYWKVIVARKGPGIETFAFVLEQDLTEVALEFGVPAAWRQRRISIAELEATVGLLTFPREMHESDGH